MILSDLQGRGTIHGVIRGGGGGGVTDYDDLANRPSINTHIVTGSKTGHDYDLANLEDVLIKELNPIITPGENYPRLEHIKDKDDNIYIVKYPAFTGAISGLVPQVVNPSGKVLNDSGSWSVIPTVMDYSLTEQNTGQKWIDGKYIYVKTIQLGATVETNTWFNIEPHNNIYDRVIKAHANGVLFSTDLATAHNDATYLEGRTSTAIPIDTVTIYYTKN